MNVRYAGSNAARAHQAVLQPVMIFAFEPNACLGNHRVNIGGTVIVTPTGCEELNQSQPKLLISNRPQKATAKMRP